MDKKKTVPVQQSGKKIPVNNKTFIKSTIPGNRTLTVVADGDHEDDEFQYESKILQKPDDQLELTEQELKEEVTRMLKANNPHAPQNIVRFSYKDKCYKPIPHIDQLAIHFQVDGTLIHKESDEAKRQIAKKGDVKIVIDGDSKKEGNEAKKAEDAEDEEGKQGGNKKLTNQFNFSERASQTYNNPYRERGTMTEPPPRANFSANATQWTIYDAYQEDFEENQKKKEQKSSKKTSGSENKPGKRTAMMVLEQEGLEVKVKFRSAKIIERMVCQNIYDEINQDFKYWEDDADEFREQEGSLLPLWKMTYEKCKKMSVCGIAWNPRYPDLFTVGYGSYDFLKQSKGLICRYSLKNPSFPEYVYNTVSGVMSVDVHPEYPNLLCAGFYDGTVGVYNSAEITQKANIMSNAKNGKHTDAVWQVRWQKDDLDGNMNFFSVSSDGRVCRWTVVKSALIYADVVSLSVDNYTIEDKGVNKEGPVVAALGCGTCLDFNKHLDHLFLVGTEEGRIYKCSKTYNNQFLDVYDAHHMSIYAVRWNPFHPKIFATCSADWTVKIWDHTIKEPLFTYDLGSAVGDISWAHYSSTVFCAVNADGKVLVFDLNVNKYEPICEQTIVQKKKAKLTHVSFNKFHPIIVVGDDRGHITLFKLSPNLRKKPKDKKGLEQAKNIDYEVQKLDKILALVRDPDEMKKRRDDLAAK